MGTKPAHKIGAALLIAVLFLGFARSSVANSASRPITVTVNYGMSGSENEKVALKRAALKARRLALEEAAAQVKKHDEVTRLNLTDEEVLAVAATVMVDTITRNRETKTVAGTNIQLTIQALLDSEELISVAKSAADKSFIKRYRLVYDEFEKNSADFEKLKTELEGTIEPVLKKTLKNSIHKTERNFEALLWFEKGFRFDIVKKVPEAIDAYTRAIELNRDFAYAYNNRGLARAERSQFKEAIEDFNKAILIKPNFAYAYINRGLANADLKLFDRAIEDYNVAILLSPNDADGYNNRGIAYYNKKKITQAIEDFNRSIELNPNGAMAYNNRGNAYKDSGNNDKAIEDFNKALSINPEIPHAYNNRGLTYIAQKRYDLALKDFDSAIKIDPKNPEAYNNRANTLKSMGKADMAISDYDKAVELNPRHAAAYFNRANAYKGMEKYDQAISDFTRALKLQPDNVYAYGNRATCYYMKKQIKESLDDFKRACELGDESSCNNHNAILKSVDQDRASR